MDSIVNPSLIFALGATFCFAVASTAFTHYARKANPMWMNAFKAGAALICFFIGFLFTKDFSHMPKPESLMAFFISGFVGLNVGDIFLMTAFARIGAARTLMIFSFQPLLMALFAYLVFGQIVTAPKLIAIVFMIACVITMSYEKFREEGRWEIRGPFYAGVGVLLDSVGILLTRYGFNTDPLVGTLEGNFYRVVGAVVGFAVMAQVKPFRMVSTFKVLKPKSRWIVSGAAVLGTFISLSLYLNAVRYGNLAAVTAIAGTCPLLAALLESALAKRWPSKFLILALILFAAGFAVLNMNGG